MEDHKHEIHEIWKLDSSIDFLMGKVGKLAARVDDLADEILAINDAAEHEHGIKDTPGLEERLDVIEKDLIALRSSVAELTAMVVHAELTLNVDHQKRLDAITNLIGNNNKAIDDLQRQIDRLENPHNCIGC